MVVGVTDGLKLGSFPFPQLLLLFFKVVLNMIEKLLLALGVLCEFLRAAVQSSAAVLDEFVIGGFDPLVLGLRGLAFVWLWWGFVDLSILFM